MFDFNVTVKKEFRHRTRGGTRTVYGKMRVQAETAKNAEDFVTVLMHPDDHAGPLQPTDTRIVWDEEPSSAWEYTAHTFEVCIGEAEQLDVATPLTRERLLAWAEGQLLKEPTYEDSVWDSDTKKMKTVVLPNSVARILADILLRQAQENYAQASSRDLFEEITELVWKGTPGLANQSIMASLDEIMGSVDETLDMCETLEDLLRMFGPDPERTDGDGPGLTSVPKAGQVECGRDEDDDTAYGPG